MLRPTRPQRGRAPRPAPPRATVAHRPPATRSRRTGCPAWRREGLQPHARRDRPVQPLRALKEASARAAGCAAQAGCPSATAPGGQRRARRRASTAPAAHASTRCGDPGSAAGRAWRCRPNAHRRSSALPVWCGHEACSASPTAPLAWRGPSARPATRKAAADQATRSTGPAARQPAAARRHPKAIRHRQAHAAEPLSTATSCRHRLLPGPARSCRLGMRRCARCRAALE